VYPSCSRFCARFLEIAHAPFLLAIVGKLRSQKSIAGLLPCHGEGEIRALIGPNGSGKSTALQALAGLIKPSEGRADIEGVAVASLSRKAIAKKLAFLPQQPAAPDEMTIAQLVRQGRFPHVGLFRSYDRRDEEAIEWALERTGLTALADRTLQELSGGERQRAWISAALAQEALP
jgi:iron complex transport system ATP-binding protein